MEVFYPESRFGGFTDLDGTLAFYLRIAALVDADSVMVDYGCGRGARAEETAPVKRSLCCFKGRVKRVIGLDLDPAAASNPMVDEFHLLEGPTWPLADDSVDLCLCDNVLEHIERPELFFPEAARVLRKGGYLCIRTPNAWSYVALASRLVPNRLHASVLKRVEEHQKQEEDIFPTLYRANTVPRLRRLMRQNGFDAAVYGFESEPSYLRFSKLAYRLGVWYQRFAPSFLRTSIFAFGRLEG
jgi:SAM-dependent methyltransferase